MTLVQPGCCSEADQILQREPANRRGARLGLQREEEQVRYPGQNMDEGIGGHPKWDRCIMWSRTGA
jgi:hypothetical protein